MLLGSAELKSPSHVGGAGGRSGLGATRPCLWGTPWRHRGIALKLNHGGVGFEAFLSVRPCMQNSLEFRLPCRKAGWCHLSRTASFRVAH